MTLHACGVSISKPWPDCVRSRFNIMGVSKLWTSVFLVFGIFVLTDGRDCDTADVIINGMRECFRQVVVENRDKTGLVYQSYIDGLFTRSDFRAATVTFCSLSVPIMDCLTTKFADCSNYNTELVPLLSLNEGLMCSRDGSVSAELENMTSRFSEIVSSDRCAEVSSRLAYVECSQETEDESKMSAKDLPILLDIVVDDSLACVADKINTYDVSACGDKDDVVMLLTFQKYIDSSEFLVHPFHYSGSIRKPGRSLGRTAGRRNIFRDLLRLNNY
ncbi:hypothetical protein ScPMuIL_000204 [Solemya velum]